MVLIAERMFVVRSCGRSYPRWHRELRVRRRCGRGFPLLSQTSVLQGTPSFPPPQAFSAGAPTYTSGLMPTLTERLNADLKDAMRAGDTVRRDEIRGLIAM